jgi:putative membrane protein
MNELRVRYQTPTKNKPHQNFCTMLRRSALSLFVTLLAPVQTTAFTPHSIRSPRTNVPSLISDPTSTTILSSTDQDEIAPLKGREAYGEQSRKFRRTVFSADDWVKHRDPDRFFRNLSTLSQSGIVVQLVNEVATVTALAMLVCIWNLALIDGYVDVSGVHHDPLYQIPTFLKFALPVGPFTLSSSALGLLLVFRTNSSYSRWWEARGCWGKIINHSRNIMRMGSSWTLKGATSENQAQRVENVQNLATAVWEFPRALTRHLLSKEEDEMDFAAHMYVRLPREQADAIVGCRHRPTKALFDLSCAVDALGLPYVKRIEVDKSIVVLCDQAGACERIFSSPVPLVYTRHTARFLSLWLLLLPFALYAPFSDSWNHIGMIPCATAVSFFFFGIEELAVTLEEPFSILPMHAMTDGINLSAQEYAQWHSDDEAQYMDKQWGPSGGAA